MDTRKIAILWLIVTLIIASIVGYLTDMASLVFVIYILSIVVFYIVVRRKAK